MESAAHGSRPTYPPSGIATAVGHGPGMIAIPGGSSQTYHNESAAPCRVPYRKGRSSRRSLSAWKTSRRYHRRGIACFVHLDGERAIWVSDDGCWQWDAEAQSWTSRPCRGDPTEQVKTPAAPHESLPDEPTPAADESLGLDAGLGLDRMWSPPGAKPARRKLRWLWSGEKASRRARLLLAGIAAAALIGAALAVLLPGRGHRDGHRAPGTRARIQHRGAGELPPAMPGEPGRIRRAVRLLVGPVPGALQPGGFRRAAGQVRCEGPDGRAAVHRHRCRLPSALTPITMRAQTR